MNACSSVSIDARGIAGCELAAREVGDHLLVAHRVALGERQDLGEPQAGEAGRRSIVARSLPEPFTHSTSISRPAWSTSRSFADVLPPPKFAIARFGPSRFER